jgi:hypothetical protein
MKTYLEQIGSEKLEAAARIDDSYDAVTPIEDELGISDGGICALVIDEKEWIAAEFDERLDMLVDWLELEENYQPEVA